MKKIILALMLISSSLTCFSAIYYVPITLTNNQTNPTPVNFQQMIVVNSSLYMPYDSARLQNVEFSTGPGATGTILQTWIESGAVNTATNTVLWVNLANSIIPASGSLTIYMNFMPTNVLSASGPTGEAPQLSVIWGQYDNGANVFDLYTNWSGTSLPSGWTTSVSGASFSVNNGLTCNGAGGSVFVYYNAAQNPAGHILDSYFSSGTASSDGHDELIGWGLSPQPANFSGGNNDWWGWTNGVNAGLHQYQESGGISSGNVGQINPGNISTTYPVIVSLSWQNTDSSKASFNYGSTQTNTTNIPTITNSFPIGGYISSGGSVTYSWWRERVNPPNDMMPSANAQSVASAALNFDGINDYVSIPNNSNLNFGTGDFTAEADFQSSASQPNYTGIVVKDGASSGLGWQLVIVNNHIAAEFTDGIVFLGTANGLEGTTVLNDGNWHHLAMVVSRTNNTITLYVDGQVEANINNASISTMNISNSSVPMLIGVERTNAFYASGNIDEVRVWNVVRTQCQIKSSMNCEFAGIQNGLVAYYKFNEGFIAQDNSTTANAIDSSGNSNNGTLTNFTLNGIISNWVAPGAVVPGISCGPIIYPTINVNSGAVCSGSSFTMSPNGASTYTFSSGSAIVTPTANASYSVTGTSVLGCVSTNTAVSNVTVNALPTISASTSTVSLCTGSTATLTASGANTYTWSTSATTPIIAISPTVTASYTVTGTDANGCENMTAITQTVTNCTTGIEQYNNSEVIVYPNPNNGSFIIEPVGNGNQTLSIYDVNGKIILSQSINGKTNIDASNLNEGIYNISIFSTEGVINKRLIIIK